MSNTCSPSPWANFRDIAGISCGDRVVREGVYFRSEAPLADDGLPQGASWPPGTVIDLRSDAERSAVATPAQWPSSVEVVSLPLLAAADPTRLADYSSFTTADYTPMFESMVTERAEVLVEALETMASCRLSVLVHCSAGKDRTGILTALLLDVLGASDEAAAADFLQSNVNAELIVRKVFASMGREPVPPVPNAADELVAARTIWRAHPHGLQGWLRRNGAPDGLVAELREPFLVPR